MLYINAMSALLKLYDLKILAADDVTHVIKVWRTFAVRVTVAVLCVHVYVISFLPLRASTPQNAGTYRFTTTHKNC